MNQDPLPSIAQPPSQQSQFRSQFPSDSRQPLRASRPQSQPRDTPPTSQKNGFDGKALLRDLDLKFEGQDKLLSFMMQQIKGLEEETTQGKRTNQNLEAAFRQDRGKVEQQLRQAGDNHNFSFQDFQAKLQAVEDGQRRDEGERAEWRKKALVQEETNRAMQGVLQSLKLQGDSELGQMRQFMQDKINEDHVSNVKNKEKNTVLFNEVVRIGEVNEKHQDVISNLQVGLESRIQTLEARLQSSESNTFTAEKRTDQAQNFVTEIVEKLESKIH